MAGYVTSAGNVTFRPAMTGIDGMSNCGMLCNPENHYEWSCKKYCPGYVFRQALSSTTSVTTTTVSMDTTAHLQISVPIIGSLAAVLAILITILCILYRKKVSHMFCPLRKEIIGTAVQETEMQVIKYENELNETSEQLHSLIGQEQRAEVNSNELSNTTDTATSSLIESFCLVQDSLNEAVLVTKCPRGNTYHKQHSHQTAYHISSRIADSAFCGNQGQMFQTRNADTTVSEQYILDIEATSSDSDITVGEDSSDEDVANAINDDSRPKRLVRVITEIEV